MNKKTSLLITLAVSLALGAASTIVSAIYAAKHKAEQERYYEEFKNSVSYQTLNQELKDASNQLWEEHKITDEEHKRNLLKLESKEFDKLVIEYCQHNDDEETVNNYQQYLKWKNTKSGFISSATISLPFLVTVSCSIDYFIQNGKKKKQVIKPEENHDCRQSKISDKEKE